MRRLEAASPRRVLATLVVAQWLMVVGLALAAAHAGWIYYQGGDQLWYWTTGWLLGHGQFPQPGVGYLWTFILAPFALFTGPNLVDALPALIVFQTVFLLPIGLLCIYGIAVRLGSRLFAYWAASLWILVPLIGVWYTDAGYHARFTDALLPQGLGLTAMGDFPGMLAALVSMYFLVRALGEEATRRPDAIAAGIAAGASLAIKPSNALFLAGPAAAIAVARNARVLGWFTAGLLPAVVALAFVKWRGFGYLPLLHSSMPTQRVAAGAGSTSPVLALSLHNYIPFHWQIFEAQLDQVREHFWSVRLIEWLVIGGAIAVTRKSRPIGVLVVATFASIVILKTGSGRGGMEGGNLLRLLMPAYPAFVLMLAALPFLVPRLPERVRPPRPDRRWLGARARTGALAAAILLTAVLPIGVYAAAKPLHASDHLPAVSIQNTPIPLGRDLGVEARRTKAGVVVTWNRQHPLGGPVFYHVFRGDASQPVATCSDDAQAQHCDLQLTDLGAVRGTRFVDRNPPAGPTAYTVGVAANWLNSLDQGDVYELSSRAVAR